MAVVQVGFKKVHHDTKEKSFLFRESVRAVLNSG